MLLWSLCCQGLAETSVPQAMPRQPLAEALKAFSRQTNLQIIYEARLAAGIVSPGAQWSQAGSRYSPRQVLDQLLAGTGLEYRFLNDHTLTILRPEPRPQKTAVAAGTAERRAADRLMLQEIIVTGVGGYRGQSKFDASYAISTIDAPAIEQQAPDGLAELLAATPGLFTESSGGALGNNVYTRGLPNDNFRYVRVLEDGLPTFEEGAGAFTNADIFSRIDATIQRVEVVRGGSAAVIASNAPGSTVNSIIARGTPEPQGLVKFTGSNRGLARIDATFSGPLATGVLYHAGAYRVHDPGPRHTGFTANRGGQWRAGLSFLQERGDVYLGFKRIDDHNLFYPTVPMASADRGFPGLDPGSASMVSGDFARLSIFDGAGQRTETVDISDGVHSRIDTLTLLVDRDLGSGWQLSEKMRYIDGDILFAAVFSGGTAFDDFTDELEALQAVAPATVDLRYRYVHGDGQLLPLDQLPLALMVDQGAWKTGVELDNLISDLQLRRNATLAGGGSNELLLGYYYSQFDQVQNWNWQGIITEARHQPRLLDLVGVDGNGSPTLAYSDGGIWKHHSNLQAFQDDVTQQAFYLSDSWRLDQHWRIDAGARYQWVRKAGSVAETKTVDLGDGATLADDAVAVFTGVADDYRYRASDWAWTLGLDYRVNAELGFFGRYSSAFRFTPEFAQWFDCCQPHESNIVLEELGLKFAGGAFSAYVVLFAYDFPRIALSNQRIDSAGNIFTETASAASEALGLEWELVWLPADSLELQFSGFYQDIHYRRVEPEGAEAMAAANAVADFSGNQILRQPQTVLTLRPAWYFGEGQHQLYAALQYTGARYVDAANSVQLPAYTTVDVGFLLHIGKALEVQALAGNLTDAVGVTEGNARSGAIAAAPSRVFFGRPIFGRSLTLSASVRF